MLTCDGCGAKVLGLDVAWVLSIFLNGPEDC